MFVLFLVGGCLFVWDAHVLDRWMFVVCVGGGFFKVVFQLRLCAHVAGELCLGDDPFVEVSDVSGVSGACSVGCCFAHVVGVIVVVVVCVVVVTALVWVHVGFVVVWIVGGACHEALAIAEAGGLCDGAFASVEARQHSFVCDCCAVPALILALVLALSWGRDGGFGIAALRGGFGFGFGLIEWGGVSLGLVLPSTRVKGPLLGSVGWWRFSVVSIASSFRGQWAAPGAPVFNLSV